MRYVIVLFAVFFSLAATANQSVTKREVSSPIDVKTLALQKSYLQAVDCRMPKKLTHLLKQSLNDTDDLTAKGHNASVFEELMMNNPSCFIQALNDLPQKVCQQVADNFIQETFFYPRSDIKQALSSAKNYRNSCIAS